MYRTSPALLSLFVIILSVQAASLNQVEAQVIDPTSNAASSQEMAQEALERANQSGGSGLGWGLFIAIMVIAVCGSVVYLCYHAMQAWNDHWRWMALTPLVILWAWVILIAVSKLLDPASHALWAFELFAWAMITTIYLVILMTAKRTFEKAEGND